jgi:hypothetical protein
MSIKPITLILTKLSIKNNNINEAKPEPNPVEPKKRGRPKKNISENKEALIEPKKRGRPKKNNAVVLINREEVTEPKEPKKRGRPKKNLNLTIANDTSSESSCENNQPKKRGRPKKIETKEESDDESDEESDDSEEELDSDENGEEVEGFYIKLDKNSTTGYTFVSSVSESEYIIRANFKLYNPHTFMYCGIWDPIRGKPLKPP